MSSFYLTYAVFPRYAQWGLVNVAVAEVTLKVTVKDIKDGASLTS